MAHAKRVTNAKDLHLPLLTHRLAVVCRPTVHDAWCRERYIEPLPLRLPLVLYNSSVALGYWEC